MRSITHVFASIILLCCVAAGIVHAADPSAAKVEYTRIPDEVRGLAKLGIVHGKASKVFGGQDGLRARAIAEAQAEAAKLGATIILISVDNFSGTPINNVSIEAVAYGPAKDGGPKSEVVAEGEKRETAVVSPAPPEGIETTRLADDIKGRTRLGVVHGKASRVYGSQDKLRAKAIIEAKDEAFKLGASIILIQVDNFEGTPINNVTIEAVAYK